MAGSTVLAYRERLERFARFIGDQRVTPLLCKTYVPHLLASGMSRRSALAFYSTVQTMHNWLHEAGVITANPVPKLRRFVVPHSERSAMTQEDVDKILAHCRNVGRRDWVYATLCGWETGLRLGDVATLRWCEVNQTELTIRRTPIKTQRFGKVVEIPISVTLLQAMRDCPPYEEADPSWVCQTLGQLHAFDAHKTISGQFAYHAKKAGVNKSFHSLRHGLVSRLLNKGVPTSVVRSITGQSLRVLETYSHADISAKRAAVA